MDIKATQESIRQMVTHKGDFFQDEPLGVISSVTSAGLLPFLNDLINSDENSNAEGFIFSPSDYPLLNHFLLEYFQTPLDAKKQSHIRDSALQDEIAYKLKTEMEAENEQGSEFRQEVSSFIQAINGLEILLNKIDAKIKLELSNKFDQLGEEYPEFGWITKTFLTNQDPLLPEIIHSESKALITLSPTEIVEKLSAEITPVQRQFLDAIQTWHVSELARVEARVERFRRIARYLLGMLGLALVILFLVFVYGIQANMSARENAASAATNVGIAVDVARIAGTDVVVAGTARAASTQVVATAQTGATQMVKQNEEAQNRAKMALASQLAAQSLAHLENQLDLALLLSIEAYKTDDTYQTRNSLLTALNYDPRLDRLFHNPFAGIQSIAFSPNGKLLAAGGMDHSIVIWDMDSGRMIGKPIKGHTDTIYSLAFSPDGKYLASGSGDNTIRILDVSTSLWVGSPILGHTGKVYSVTFSPDGKLLASGSGDKTVRVWDWHTRQLVGNPLTGHTADVMSVAFSPDGSTLASGSFDSTIRLWNVEGSLFYGKGMFNQTAPVYQTAFSHDGQFLASSRADGSIFLWNLHTSRLITSGFTSHKGGGFSLDFSPDGLTLATAGDDGIMLWDLSKLNQPLSGGVLLITSPFSGQNGPILSVKFSSDGKTLAAGGTDNVLRLWSVPVALGSGVAGGMRLSGHSDAVYSVAFDPSSKILASGSWDKTIRLWDISSIFNPALSSGSPPSISLMGHQDYVLGVTISPDGNLLASCGVDKSILLWDITDFKNVKIVDKLVGHEGWVRSVAFSPDGKKLASGSWDGTIRFWDQSDRIFKPGQVLNQGKPVYSVAFDPVSNLFASGGETLPSGNSLILWNLANQEGNELGGQAGFLYSVSISPDGKTLAAGSSDRTINLWDLPGSSTKPSLTSHTGDVLSVAYSLDGKFLASGSSDHTIILWDTAVGKPIGSPLAGHNNFIYSVAFSPNGKYLASGSSDNSVILWDVDPESWLVRACRRAGRNLNQAEWAAYFPGLPYQKSCLAYP